MFQLLVRKKICSAHGEKCVSIFCIQPIQVNCFPSSIQLCVCLTHLFSFSKHQILAECLRQNMRLDFSFLSFKSVFNTQGSEASSTLLLQCFSLLSQYINSLQYNLKMLCYRVGNVFYINCLKMCLEYKCFLLFQHKWRCAFRLL